MSSALFFCFCVCLEEKGGKRKHKVSRRGRSRRFFLLFVVVVVVAPRVEIDLAFFFSFFRYPAQQEYELVVEFAPQEQTYRELLTREATPRNWKPWLYSLKEEGDFFYFILLVSIRRNDEKSENLKEKARHFFFLLGVSHDEAAIVLLGAISFRNEICLFVTHDFILMEAATRCFSTSRCGRLSKTQQQQQEQQRQRQR